MYALLERATDKGDLARRILARTSVDGVLAVQALIELLAVTRRQRPDQLALVLQWINDLAPAYHLGATHVGVLTIAGELALRHRLQIFDAVIIAASAEAGARLLLSEDMQDGQRIGGLRILNPFNPANRPEIDAMLA